MPMQRDLYPPDWDAIATDIKDACDWTCQQCGRQCRRPGEPFDTQARTLTVAHLEPEDHDPSAPVVFVAALCPACHLASDAPRKAAKRRAFNRRFQLAFA